MYIPKRYGLSKTENCPFCGKLATARNSQGISVCNAHNGMKLQDIKCVCGSMLELKKGKFGPFFVCINCGTISLAKGMEMLSTMQKPEKKVCRPEEKGPVSDPGKYPGFDYGVY